MPLQQRQPTTVWLQEHSQQVQQQVQGSAPLPLLSAFKTTSGVLGPVLVSPVQERLTYWSRSSGGPPSWSGVGAQHIRRKLKEVGLLCLASLLLSKLPDERKKRCNHSSQRCTAMRQEATDTSGNRGNYD